MSTGQNVTFGLQIVSLHFQNALTTATKQPDYNIMYDCNKYSIHPCFRLPALINILLILCIFAHELCVCCRGEQMCNLSPNCQCLSS